MSEPTDQGGGGRRGVCLVSGGLDSCVTLAVALQDGLEACVLHADYGQRTQQRERAAFRAIADHYQVTRRLEVDLSYLGRIGGSSLLAGGAPVPAGSIPLERGQVTDADGARVPSTYVPFRNAHMLAVAVSWAEVLGAEAIYVGAVQEDSSGYPDCRREFYDAFEQAIALGTRPETGIAIRTPLVHLSKAEIVRLGLRLGAPLALSWSCYTGEELACGICESCQLRLRGFREAGTPDPIPYEEPAGEPGLNRR